MREIAQTRVCYGYRRINVLLKREDWQLGKDQAYRLYSEEQLQLRSKLPKRRKIIVTREARIKAEDMDNGERTKLHAVGQLVYHVRFNN